MTAWMFVAGPVKPNNHVQGDLESLARRTRAATSTTVSSNWSATPRNKYARADTVYLWLRMQRLQGLIGQGRVIDPNPEPGDPGLPLAHKSMFDIQWDAVLTVDELLPREDVADVVTHTKIPPGGSGFAVDQQDEQAVAALWSAHLATLGVRFLPRPLLQPRAEGSGRRPPRLTKVTIPSNFRKIETQVRTFQGRFRRLLLNEYPNECAYCGLADVRLLDAAHITAVRDGGEATAENGRLLCANHHRAFDSDLLFWDPQTSTFQLTPGTGPVPPVGKQQSSQSAL